MFICVVLVNLWQNRGMFLIALRLIVLDDLIDLACVVDPGYGIALS